MRFRDYFSSDFETSEHHDIVSLRSRYYRCRNEEAMEAVKRVANQLRAVITYIDRERHEIIFETPQFSATATVVSPSFTETAIDLKVTTTTLFPFGKGKRVIESLYEALDKMLPYKGVGLYQSR